MNVTAKGNKFEWSQFILFEKFDSLKINVEIEKRKCEFWFEDNIDNEMKLKKKKQRTIRMNVNYRFKKKKKKESPEPSPLSQIKKHFILLHSYGFQFYAAGMYYIDLINFVLAYIFYSPL